MTARSVTAQPQSRAYSKSRSHVRQLVRYFLDILGQGEDIAYSLVNISTYMTNVSHVSCPDLSFVDHDQSGVILLLTIYHRQYHCVMCNVSSTFNFSVETGTLKFKKACVYYVSASDLIIALL